jgi:hypothetical protein
MHPGLRRRDFVCLPRRRNGDDPGSTEPWSHSVSSTPPDVDLLVEAERDMIPDVLLLWLCWPLQSVRVFF